MSAGLYVSQILFLQNSYTTITFTFPIIAILFLYHYNAYDIKTGTLDYNAFESYVEDLRGKDFTLVSAYLQNMTMDRMQELSSQIYYFNEKFFKHTCIFRVRDEKLIMAIEDKKNPNMEEGLKHIVETFENMYEQLRIDYKLVIMHSDYRIHEAHEYLEMDEYYNNQIDVNTAYIPKEEDIEKYMNVQFVLRQLRDIATKHDLNDDRVRVFCQPVLNTERNQFTSAEALMRLYLPGYGMVYPDVFIPLAERYDQIHTLSLIILNKTCKEIKRLEEEGYQIERISVNFSMTELRNPNFCQDIFDIIEANEIPFGKIAIELTESMDETEFENVKRIMREMHDVGVKFYLDDFGTGYSNFERIIELPVDIIKFDRSLTIMASKDENSQFMVGSFSEIFKRSNYQILFEGVEDEDDAHLCIKMNALYLQGYHYSKPIPIEKLSGFLEKKTA